MRLVCTYALWSLGVHAAVQVRGVAPQQSALYEPDADGMFRCIEAPHIRIPFERVNDDYCDCPDGSDEPGTSACEAGMFYCVGSDKFISSRFVDDGVCDYEICCDGSDESSGLCEDRCAEYRAREAEKAAHAQELLAVGRGIRSEYEQEAAKRRDELLRRAGQLQELIDEVSTRLKETKAEYQVAVEEDGLNSDAGSVQALATLRRTLVAAEHDIERLRNELQSALDANSALNAAFQTMETEYNPNFNDPAVKEALRAWKSSPSAPQKVDVVSLVVDEALFSKIRVARADDVDLSEPTLFEWLSRFFSSLVGAWIPVSKHQGGSQSVRAEALKEVIDELSEQLKEFKKELGSKKKSLQLGAGFYGPHEVGRAVEDLCLNTNANGIEFKICLFGLATIQQGHKPITLGTSQGLRAEGDTAVIEFANGEPCSYGVSRSLRLVLTCGEKHELEQLNVQDNCFFMMKGHSPLACASEEDAGHEDPSLNPIVNSDLEHDEL